MSRISKIVGFCLASILSIALIASSHHVVAKDKDKKEKKDDKKDPKKEEKKKEEKKPEFKLDTPAQEFKNVEKEKTFWVLGVAFGADGKSLAAAYKNFSIIIWDLPGKKAAQTIKLKETRGVGDFRGLLYFDDQIMVGSGKLIKYAKEKDKEKTKETGKDKDKAKEVKERPFREGEIKVFDAKTGMPGKSLLGHGLNVEALARSKDGKFIASGGDDGTVKIWDAAGKVTQTIKGNTADVTSVSFSPDGKQIVTTSIDRTVRVFDIAGAKELASFKVEREIEVKEPAKGKGKDKGKDKGKVTKKKEEGRDFTAAVFSSDGKKIIAGNREGMVKIYDVDGKKELQEIKAHEGILTLALSPDGSKIATGGYDQTIKIWDASSGKELKKINAHLGNVLTLSFSPDSQWLASGSTDGTVKIWSVK